MKVGLKLKYLNVSLLMLMVSISCNTVKSNEGDGEGNVESCNGENWMVPCQQIVDGGPGIDGIPSIDDPNFTAADEVDFLEDWELVVGIKSGNETKAYPHVILYYHEIVNDSVGELPVALTFCPLTGSGIGWNRMIDGEVTEFGVSGLIHKNNLIPYDRNTGSRWSQMLNKSINGELSGRDVNIVQVVEMSWGAWKNAYPGSKVLNTDTGYNRNYSQYLYGRDYSSDDSRILFPVYHNDERLNEKALVHGVKVGFNTKVYPIEEFGNQIELINDEFEGEKILVAGSSEIKLAVSYNRTLEDGTVLNFSSIDQGLPLLAEDQEGTIWNIFGEAVSGPREGDKLTATGAYNAYWFAWADFFNFPQIHSF
jgi:hypothetical protein